MLSQNLSVPVFITSAEQEQSGKELSQAARADPESRWVKHTSALKARLTA